MIDVFTMLLHCCYIKKSNFKPLTDLYNWDSIKHPTVIKNNNYAIRKSL